MLDEYYIIAQILAKYPDITEEESQVLNNWIAQNGNQVKFDLIIEGQTRKIDLNRFLRIKEKKEANRKRYHEEIASINTSEKTYWWNGWKTYVAAASVIGLLCLISYKWYDQQKQSKNVSPVVVQLNDVNPGQFRAKLTLDDGSTIILDSAVSGKLIQQGNTQVINKDGKLLYQEDGKANKTYYNTLATAKGETYGTVLSDGTQVWLNSQSTVRYPVPFDGDMRRVQITGQAYFEVTPSLIISADGKKRKRPFIVSASGLEVEVLGTHFDINSYSDESSVKTTLLEGKVKVTSPVSSRSTQKQSVLLLPGEQATFNNASQLLNKSDNVNVDEAVAWHNGYFQFNSADLQTVLRQLVRWYDVEVEYKGKINQREFWGKISRSNTLSQVLETLETNEVHFKLEGKKIIVSS